MFVDLSSSFKTMLKSPHISHGMFETGLDSLICCKKPSLMALDGPYTLVTVMIELSKLILSYAVIKF
jgi:hypothetical protein